MKFYVGSKSTGAYFKNEIRKMFANDGGFVSLAKVKELFRENSNNEERQIGWDEKADLGKKMRVRECKDGWYLYLPEPNTKLWFDDNEKRMHIKSETYESINSVGKIIELFEENNKRTDDYVEKEIEAINGITKALGCMDVDIYTSLEKLMNMIDANSGYFYRLCTVKAKKSGRKEERQDRNAKFHRWADLSKGVQQVVAIVEFDDGHIEQVQPDRVVFKEVE